MFFFNTGLEMAATKRHVKEIAEKYGVEIVEHRPKKNIVMAVREYGVPFISKHFSQAIETLQKTRTPFDIRAIYDKSEDKSKIFAELCNCYPHAKQGIAWICSCDCKGREAYDFMQKNPIGFKVSAKCCVKCKKEVAHRIQKDYDIIITGGRKAEGGIRAIPHKKINDESTECFYEQRDGKHRFRPLYYVSDKDKAWYKERWNLKYSDAYEVYGLKRTGCCGCPISARAVEDLERIRPYEPNVVKAAWAIFGDSYPYRAEYNAFKEHMKRTADGQLTFDDIK